MEKQYSDHYYKMKEQFEKAEAKFDAKPNAKTATALSEARKNFQQMPESKKYTGEYAEWLKAERKAYEKEQLTELQHLMQVVGIETAFERGQISNEERLNQHKANDIVNPCKYSI